VPQLQGGQVGTGVVGGEAGDPVTVGVGQAHNTVRPHEALAWNRPAEVHRRLADPAIPNFDRPEILPSA
jgi:hypothetical protein